jgi:hypothetical protein
VTDHELNELCNAPDLEAGIRNSRTDEVWRSKHVDRESRQMYTHFNRGLFKVESKCNVRCVV